ncbi:MAG: DUF4145 domain-containing protein [Proteobacteria bacterium]|nr:MAG: DUF4145 domain-containing protein [Pseudomonadota bacterium]
MVQVGEDEWDTEIKERIFPERRRRAPLPDAQFLPYKIENIYQETFLALNQGQRILAGIGIRALIEAICNNRKVTGTLEKMINKLVVSNALRQAEADILHKMRFMGNEAAHKTSALSENSLSLAFDIVEHLLVNVFLLEKRAKELPDRKKVVPKRAEV